MPFSLPPGMQIQWLGHSAFLITTPRGKRVLIDPWVQNNPACPAENKDLGRVDLMLITHGHYDHIEDAVPIATQTGCKIIAVFETALWLTAQGVAEEKVLPMNKGGSLHLPDLGFTVTMVHADHSCGIKDGEQVIYGGEAVGYVVTLDEIGFAFYHAGDTAVFSDMELIADLYRPQLALLPIGDRFVMSPREAARAVKFLYSVEAVVPMHFGTFPLLTGTPDRFAHEMDRARLSVELWPMRPGEVRG